MLASLIVRFVIIAAFVFGISFAVGYFRKASSPAKVLAHVNAIDASGGKGSDKEDVSKLYEKDNEEITPEEDKKPKEPKATTTTTTTTITTTTPTPPSKEPAENAVANYDTDSDNDADE